MPEIPRHPRNVGTFRRMIRQELDLIDAASHDHGVDLTARYKMPATKNEKRIEQRRVPIVNPESIVYQQARALEATEEDYTQRMHEQWRRYRELDKSGQLTPEWRKWAERNRDKR
jgi:hypothetical protein